MTSHVPSLSVVITNFNYGKFVAIAIESLLSQEPRPQIIVVDDCSTDNSRDIISAFKDQVTVVFQAVNQGHGGGFNAGFERATGDLVMFLDADDFMLPGSTETITANFQPAIVMYHYRMRYADEQGKLGGVYPRLSQSLAQGDISTKLRTRGEYDGTITSGLVFARSALLKVLPMDPERYRQGGDGYLSATVPLYGPSASFDHPISGYRLHSEQHSKFANAYAKRARWGLQHKQQRHTSIAHHAAKLGLTVVPDLASADSGMVQDRLVSILLEPDKHPVAADTLDEAIRQAKLVSLQSKTGARRLLDLTWWTIFSWGPQSTKQKLLTWRIDANSRPRWAQAPASFIRRRFFSK